MHSKDALDLNAAVHDRIHTTKTRSAQFAAPCKQVHGEEAMQHPDHTLPTQQLGRSWRVRGKSES